MLYHRHQIGMAVHIRIPINRCRFRPIGRGQDAGQRTRCHLHRPNHVILVAFGILADNQRVHLRDKGQIVGAGNAVYITGIPGFGRISGVIHRLAGQYPPDPGADKGGVQLHLIHRPTIILVHANVVAARQVGLFVGIGHALGHLRHRHI